MAYVYLLDLHQLIDQRLAEAGKAVDKTKNDPFEKRFHEGRIEILSAFKDFLTENLRFFDRKFKPQTSPQDQGRLFWDEVGFRDAIISD
ncbi:MAG: hypothetical protein JRJ46_10890 [Deltaproteobacteria bacterium]|nr:hypothetical protein [Deltaproteobacteria bacterium]